MDDKPAFVCGLEFVGPRCGPSNSNEPRPSGMGTPTRGPHSVSRGAGAHPQRVLGGRAWSSRPDCRSLGAGTPTWPAAASGSPSAFWAKGRTCGSSLRRAVGRAEPALRSGQAALLPSSPEDAAGYFALRCQRVAFSIFLCLCLRIFLRRFLMTEPNRSADPLWIRSSGPEVAAGWPRPIVQRARRRPVGVSSATARSWWKRGRRNRVYNDDGPSGGPRKEHR